MIGPTDHQLYNITRSLTTICFTKVMVILTTDFTQVKVLLTTSYNY